ncbi:uncharacterized protein LOC122383837 [Amphibalanus amphitrite]|uniref:uncharacterized protein LOC122383837 n=1 Tax=Amphibalanus amphitrite TaxID=1232801 RepID=UPI001C900CB9|nr:uncharacterized protein LOC122383837 [Amphibalanus amphitrite]
MPAASRGSLVEVQETLYAAFAMDSFAAYDAFCCRRLRTGESPDVFLSDLRRLAVLFGASAAGKQRGRGRISAGVLSRAAVAEVLPMAQLRVAGRECRAIVDSGCTENLVFAPYCSDWRKERVRVTSMSGDPFYCDGVGKVAVETASGQAAVVDVLVMREKPLGAEMVIGVSGISALGGVLIGSQREVRFCGAVSRLCDQLTVEASDFGAQFDPVARAWTVAWKWRDGAAPECLGNGVAEYSVPEDAKEEFDAELQSWIENEWLVPYDEDLYGPPRGLIPLMAVQQKNKTKVRPVLDYRELNSHVVPHTADADVCAATLRKWRRHGTNVAIVDLKRAYLQLRTEQSLWPFQTVMVNGQRYALSRVGFGLNVAPLIMKAVVRAVLQQDPAMESAVLPYMDDLCVNEDIVSAERVVAHFAQYGLECKPPERAAAGARLLGLHVRAVGGVLRWARDNVVGPPPVTLTRRSVFAWCGRLVAHLPVCGWLRPAAAWLKRRANAVTNSWDLPTDDATLRQQVDYVASRLARDDPAHGRWHVEGDHAVVWTDASSIAAGVVLETPTGDPIEDGCWLRRDETAHINMAELDAAVRGINLAIAWEMRRLDLRTDSATVHRWISDALSGRSRLKTKAHGEMIIRRRIDMVKQLVDEFGIDLSVTLVPTAHNRADCLTRVPVEWVRGDDPSVGEPAVAAAVVGPVTDAGEDDAHGADAGVVEDTVGTRESSAISEVHAKAGHPGIRRTLYFARRDISPSITRSQVQKVVSDCDVCRSVDPAPVKWRGGELGVKETWTRLAIDITHYRNRSYLSIIDCGPSRFCVWRPLRRTDSASVTEQLEEIFCGGSRRGTVACQGPPVMW